MTFSAEAFIALLAMLGAIGSLGIHVLLRIDKTVTNIQTTNAVKDAETKLTIDALHRHLLRNEAETAQLTKHVFPQRQAS